MADQRKIYSFSELIDLAKLKISLAGSKLTDWNTGSNALSITEAVAHFVEYLQLRNNEAFEAFSINKATGDNLRVRGRDYNLEMKSAVASYGIITFGRNLPSNAAFTIYAGSQVSTQPDVFGNTVNFTTDADIQFPSGGISVTGMVTCTIAGTIGNVPSGTITNITSSIPGIDFVTNAAVFGAGADDETDEQFRDRLATHINGLKKGNEDAVRAAALSVPGIVLARIAENVPAPGQITAYISNQSGTIPPEQIAAVKTAAEDAAAFGILANIATPTINYVTLSFDVYYDSDNYDQTVVDQELRNSLYSYININPDTTLQVDDLILVARKVSGISKVKNVSINGVADDYVASGFSVIRLADTSASISINWNAI
jgi:uncharacterized phage protein gp47/JayE